MSSSKHIYASCASGAWLLKDPLCLDCQWAPFLPQNQNCNLLQKSNIFDLGMKDCFFKGNIFIKCLPTNDSKESSSEELTIVHGNLHLVDLSIYAVDLAYRYGGISNAEKGNVEHQKLQKQQHDFCQPHAHLRRYHPKGTPLPLHLSWCTTWYQFYQQHYQSPPFWHLGRFGKKFLFPLFFQTQVSKVAPLH